MKPRNVPFDRKAEKPIPLATPTALGSDRTRQTLVRWALHGCESRATREVVKLEAIYIGAQLYSSAEAYGRFIDRLNGN